MTVVLLVLAILAGVALIQAAIWIPLIRRWKRGAAAFDEKLATDMAASGERFVIEPEKAVYRGASRTYGAVRGNGTILLTDRRLIFRKISGGEVEIAVAKIIGTREETTFLGSRVGGQVHFVIDTSDPAEVGFFVGDRAEWAQAMASVRPGT